ncbi:hypothetical protein JXL21_02390 [Candidatus Bathyarchaeota archaeon]|nr:hypothetical protein [Candidatus Bathyarchaeota archaeon]
MISGGGYRSTTSPPSISQPSPAEYGGLGLRYSSRGGEAFSNRLGDAVKLNRKNGDPIAFTPENPRRTLRTIQELKDKSQAQP